MTDENELNPAILDEEPSTSYDPFAEARRLDDEYARENGQHEAQEQPQTEPRPEQPQEQPQPSQQEQKPNGHQLTQEEYDRLVRYANLGRDYEQWSQTDEGKSASDFIQKRRNDIAEQAKAKAKENPYDTALGNFGEANRKFLGDNPEEYQNAVQGFVREEARKQIQEMLGPQMREMEFAKQNRIGNEMRKIADDYVEYISESFGMSQEDARNITKKKISEMVKTIPYDRDTYIRELKGFAGGELLTASHNIARSQSEEIASLKAQLAQYQQGQQPQPVPGTSTAAAAERILNQSNADYKRGGAIPSGATGAPQGGYVDEADEALAYFGTF